MLYKREQNHPHHPDMETEALGYEMIWLRLPRWPVAVLGLFNPSIVSYSIYDCSQFILNLYPGHLKVKNELFGSLSHKYKAPKML